MDARPLQSTSAVRGIGTYTRGLLEGLAQLGVLGDVVLMLQNGAPPAELRRLGVTALPARVPVVQPTLQRLLDPLLVARALRSVNADVYHSVDIGQPLSAAMRVVVTVHDLIPFRFPRWYGWARRSRRPALRQLHRADRVIAVSTSTADDIRRFSRVPEDRIVVIPEAVSETFHPATDAEIDTVRTRHGINRPYLLAVGTFDPRKRIAAVAAVAHKVRRAADVQLVIAGAQHGFAGDVEQALRAESMQGSTILLGHVDAAELRALYTGAVCLLFTSAYEGFGLPLLEAMACGTPVVAFRNSSVPEVSGDAALLCDDGDAEAMAREVLRIIADSSLRSELVSRGRIRAAGFSWRDTAERTHALYRQLAG